MSDDPLLDTDPGDCDTPHDARGPVEMTEAQYKAGLIVQFERVISGELIASVKKDGANVAVNQWGLPEFAFKPAPQRKPVRFAGRNEKCPCGSGAKYKKCHGRR